MNIRFAVITSVAALALIAGPGALLAHHGSAIYDESHAVQVDGVVTDWVWANPHCLLEFDAKNEKGESVHWTAEVSNPPDMIARGWSRKMFKAGDEITITLVPGKGGQPIGRILSVEVGGKTYTGMGTGAPPAAPADKK